MFSLIITIISIALVAALALATLYYGGDAFNQGTSEAEASKLLNQGQQLLGAAELYKAKTGAWPKNVETLAADGYLKTIPHAMTAVSEAVAAGNPWVMPMDYTPVFTVPNSVSAVCAKVNKTGYGIEGILALARSFIVTQCYGENSSYTVVMARSASDLVAALPPAQVTSDAIPAVGDADSWEVPPGTTVASGSGSTESGTAGRLAVPSQENSSTNDSGVLSYSLEYIDVVTRYPVVDSAMATRQHAMGFGGDGVFTVAPGYPQVTSSRPDLIKLSDSHFSSDSLNICRPSTPIPSLGLDSGSCVVIYDVDTYNDPGYDEQATVTYTIRGTDGLGVEHTLTRTFVMTFQSSIVNENEPPSTGDGDGPVW